MITKIETREKEKSTKQNKQDRFTTNKINKTGLQPVSRPVEQVPLPRGWVQRSIGARVLQTDNRKDTEPLHHSLMNSLVLLLSSVLHEGVLSISV